MHIAPLIAIDPDPLLGSVDDALEDLTRLADLLAERDVPLLAVTVSAHVLEVAAEDKDLAARLTRLPVVWVRMGWGHPAITLVPDRLTALAIERETSLLDRLGLEPGPFWIRHRWDRRLPTLLAEAGIETLLLDAALAPETSGVAVHHHWVLPALAVEDADETLPTGSDEVRVWLTPIDRLPDLISKVAATPGCDLTTPDRYLADHPVTGRLGISDSPPPAFDEEQELLYRRLIRIAGGLAEKIPSGVVAPLLAASHAPLYEPGAPAALRAEAHRRLILARKTLDDSRRRGDDWGRVMQLDWDADGVNEVALETAQVSLIVDPEDRGRLVLVDDKADPWPVTYLPGEHAGWLCRFSNGENGTIPFVPNQGDPKATIIDLAGTTNSGSISCQITIDGRTITFEYRLEGWSAMLGPEISLAVGSPRIRVDGSAWSDLTTPRSMPGHRFRLAGDRRDVLLTSMVPAETRFRPVPGGAVVWFTWPAEGPGQYRLSLDLAP